MPSLKDRAERERLARLRREREERAARSREWVRRNLHRYLQRPVERDPYGGRRGERHANAKLTDDQVAELRRRRDSGERYKSLARGFGVSMATVSLICSGRQRRYRATAPP